MAKAVEFVSRPSQNEITIYYDSSTLTGGEVLSVIFPGSSSPITGTYSPVGATSSNVLFIIVDDWGIDSSPIDNFSGALNGAAGTGGTDLPEMPNLVNLANSSVRFSNGYVQAACSTTRMAIMSGRLPSSNGVGAPGSSTNTRDATNIMTIAEAIDTSGSSYTSVLLGKWHLGNGTGINDQGPKADGWDTFFGALTGNLTNYYDWTRSDIDELQVNRLSNPANELNYATITNTDDALDFINGQDNTNTPWLCWVAYNAPHSQSDTPIFPSPPTTLNGIAYTGALNTNRDNYKAALWALDNELNRLLSNVDLTTTTLIFVGDNGTPGNVMGDNNFFASNHGKGTIYDGGLHVPFLIRPAGGTTGKTIDEPVADVDIFPTMTALMGFNASSLGEDLDGESLLPLINGTGSTDGMIVGETFQSNNSGRTIRKGDYKINIHEDPLDNTDTPSVEFFNLSTSLQEDTSDNLLRAGYTMTSAEQAAYNDLLSENNQLNVGKSITYTTSPPAAPNIITTNLDMTGVSGVNQSNGATVNQVPQLNVAIQSVSIGGVAATNFSRTTNGTTTDRYWVTFDFDENSSGLSASTYDIVVQYAGGPRVFTVTGGYNLP